MLFYFLCIYRKVLKFHTKWGSFNSKPTLARIIPERCPIRFILIRKLLCCSVTQRSCTTLPCFSIITMVSTSLIWFRVVLPGLNVSKVLCYHNKINVKMSFRLLRYGETVVFKGSKLMQHFQNQA